LDAIFLVDSCYYIKYYHMIVHIVLNEYDVIQEYDVIIYRYLKIQSVVMEYVKVMKCVTVALQR